MRWAAAACAPGGTACRTQLPDAYPRGATEDTTAVEVTAAVPETEQPGMAEDRDVRASRVLLWQLNVLRQMEMAQKGMEVKPVDLENPLGE